MLYPAIHNIRSYPTLQEQPSLKGHDEAVFSVAFTPDGKTLASVSYDGTIYLWQLTGKKKRLRLPSMSPFGLVSVAISGDGKKLAACGVGNCAEVWALDLKGW